jgi:RimJ/RimL family protein N-acetyltransferase
MHDPYATASAAVAQQRRDHLMAAASNHRLARVARQPDRIGTCDAGDRALQLRVLEPTDAGLIAGLFERLSLRSRYLRFFSPVDKVPAPTILRLASVDHDRHEAVGAFADRSLVGSAHYFRSAEDATTAEIAVEVADDHQRHGVGPCLLRALARLAQQRGITHFTASVLAENRAALAMLHQSGWPTVARLSGPEVLFALTLTGVPDAGSSGRAQERAS